ncbi:hypothetical protein ILFOPFJJ_06288 [Ensifer psoraleae]|nr:hypothetical protein [Sinorhizobium psoraleae]
MDLDGLFDDPEIGGDLLVKPPCHDQFHDLYLAWREARQPLQDRCLVHLPLVFQPCTLEARLHGGEQRGSIRRLCEEVDGAGFHSFHARRDIAPAREKDHRMTSSTRHKRLLDAKAVHAGQDGGRCIPSRGDRHRSTAPRRFENIPPDNRRPTAISSRRARPVRRRRRGKPFRSGATTDPHPTPGRQGRLAPMCPQLLPALPACGSPRPAGRKLDEPHRIMHCPVDRDTFRSLTRHAQSPLL